MNESSFQRKVIGRLKEMFPGCLVMKNDANYLQGVPDLLVLHREHWAALECKVSETASHRPNQDYYVKTMNNMSYATFICPENEDEVFDELQRTLES